MSWRRPLLSTLSGAAVTLGSTVFSLGLAVQIERVGHQMIYYFAPHKYATVQVAAGISKQQLEYARTLAPLEPPRRNTESLDGTTVLSLHPHQPTPKQQQETTTTTLSTRRVLLQGHDILSCSMTG